MQNTVQVLTTRMSGLTACLIETVKECRDPNFEHEVILMMPENFTMNDKKPRTRTRKIYGDAYNLGAADGRAVSLNRQIAQTPKEGNLFPYI